MFRSNLPMMRLFAVVAWLLVPDLLVGAPSHATAATDVKRCVDGNNVRFEHHARGRRRRAPCSDGTIPCLVNPATQAVGNFDPRSSPTAMLICISQSHADQESGLAVDVVVRNVSCSTIAIDEELACYFQWKVETTDGTAISSSNIDDTDQIPLPELRRLMPQEEFRKTIELDGRGIRRLDWARGSSLQGHCFTQGWVGNHRYLPDPRLKQLRVSLTYDSTDPYLQDAFRMAFIGKEEEFARWNGKTTSNTIVLTR